VPQPLKDRLAKSAADRAAVIRKFGMVPLSVLKLSRGELSRSMFNMLGERATGSVKGAQSLAREDAFVTEAGKATARERRELGLFGGVKEYADANNRETVSVMPAELVEFFARYYSRRGATYVDPFAAQGVQMQVAHRLGMSYLGQDLSVEYVRYIDAVRKRLTLLDGQVLDVRQGDSRKPWVDDGVGDFLFTSPPYWDVEFYGPEPEQLGTGHTYAEFLDGMRQVFEAWRPKLKPSAFVVVNVNDLRRHGEFIPYHVDIVNLMRDVGYRPHDVWIIEGLLAGLPKAFAVNFNLKRIAPKVHEYCLVFRP
jgi:DNA modification methylase